MNLSVDMTERMTKGNQKTNKHDRAKCKATSLMTIAEMHQQYTTVTQQGFPARSFIHNGAIRANSVKIIYVCACESQSKVMQSLSQSGKQNKAYKDQLL